ncbi:alpha/beta hydrolase fold protein [Nostoc linckia NIES-25]|nr:alpha/beta hydrolase fold protein [Nostoc linckia NIES-25]
MSLLSLTLGNPMTRYRTVSIDGLDIFYREAGSRDNPTILLLHGFPSSSHMFRNLIPALGDRFHLVAPDYPGFGNSSMPTVNEFDYTFDRLAQIVEKFIAAIADHIRRFLTARVVENTKLTTSNK